MAVAELASYRSKLLALRGRLAGDIFSLADEAVNSENEAVVVHFDAFLLESSA